MRNLGGVATDFALLIYSFYHFNEAKACHDSHFSWSWFLFLMESFLRERFGGWVGSNQINSYQYVQEKRAQESQIVIASDRFILAEDLWNWPPRCQHAVIKGLSLEGKYWVFSKGAYRAAPSPPSSFPLGLLFLALVNATREVVWWRTLKLRFSTNWFLCKIPVFCIACPTIWTRITVYSNNSFPVLSIRIFISYEKCWGVKWCLIMITEDQLVIVILHPRSLSKPNQIKIIKAWNGTLTIDLRVRTLVSPL